jgi:hypothetical protein
MAIDGHYSNADVKHVKYLPSTPQDGWPARRARLASRYQAFDPALTTQPSRPTA